MGRATSARKIKGTEQSPGHNLGKRRPNKSGLQHQNPFSLDGLGRLSKGQAGSSYNNSSIINLDQTILNQRSTTVLGRQESKSSGPSIDWGRTDSVQGGSYPEPVDKMGRRKLKKFRKNEREKTKGSAWFNMPCAEMTAERKNDLEALSLRGALDKKRFYKRNNLPALPKYFQVGRIIEAPADYYHSRVPKRQRKQTLAEEMTAEAAAL